MTRGRRVLGLLALCAALAVQALAVAPVRAEGFPLRPYYPEVPPISTDRLLAGYDTAVVVDIRSRLEYEVAHINKAVLLPLTDKDFARKLEALRPKDGPEPLVFYCNGHACAKSYQAAQLALSLGFGQVFAYDGGIFDWITAAPDKATLMGETPARRDRVLSRESLDRRMLGHEEFERQAREPGTLVIDIRDPFQRDVVPRLPGIRAIPLDALLDLVTSRIWTEKRLLFFDAVGKQVGWLHYFLKAYDYFDYGFLDGGVRAIAGDPALVRPVVEADRTVISDQAMLLRLTADQRLDNADRRVISYLLANVKFNNYVVIDMDRLGAETGIGKPMLLNSMDKLSGLGYAVHALMQDMLIVQVDPRLAWKGELGTALWRDKVREFNNARNK
ncbi:Rhodanese domain protein [Pseudodesulfovibrio mercurii]|uniref:Rhodanese domain protein n=1 Tax=Pseudodesulfovibrio mercurii TaxID=641491 RepID=F0JEP9_9BACT|nr:rhodanese-like domain-containing protein [Pseudodesulfovibrio mercurii]EGB14778.1 Rhodanese domain protein [Pseudodesulfovibrio mercurii]